MNLNSWMYLIRWCLLVSKYTCSLNAIFSNLLSPKYQFTGRPMSCSLEILCMCLNVIYSINAAEDWLKPSVVLEAFEARSARMCVACAKILSKFENPEDGMFSIPWFRYKYFPVNSLHLYFVSTKYARGALEDMWSKGNLFFWVQDNILSTTPCG